MKLYISHAPRKLEDGRWVCLNCGNIWEVEADDVPTCLGLVVVSECKIYGEEAMWE